MPQNSLAGRQQRQQRVYNMMKDLQQKHLANMIQSKITDQENSDLSESQSICRICHSSGEEPLITPCYCSGSAKHVHASCLLTWFKKEVKNTCELCRHKVDIKKKGKPYAEVILISSLLLLRHIDTTDLYFTILNIFVSIVRIIILLVAIIIITAIIIVFIIVTTIVIFAIPLPPCSSTLSSPSQYSLNFCSSLFLYACLEIQQTKVLDRIRIFFLY